METTSTCSYGGAVHWNGPSDPHLVPLDMTDPDGTAFQFATSTCVTVGSDPLTSSSTEQIINQTQILALGLCIVVALFSALIVAKLWK